MSMIIRDGRTGKVKMAIFSTIQKNRRTLLLPQLVDVTNAKDADEIIDIIAQCENDFGSTKKFKERIKVSRAAKRAWARIWNF